MGMSASQARLLSLTTRITNNEFQSQLITNSKLRLAEKSSAVTQEYMDGLASQKLVFGLYSENGDYSDMNLTASLLYNYQPLKNQYAVINASGKMLVSAKDAENFENTNNLFNFLRQYNLVEDVELINQYKADMEEYNKADYEYKNVTKPAYDAEYAKWKEKYDAWKIAKNQPDLYDMFSKSVGTSDNPQTCYYSALNGSASCYEHVLNHLIDFDGTWDENQDRAWSDYETSANKTFIPNNRWYGAMGAKPEFKDISDAMNKKDDKGNYIKLCDGKDDLSKDGETNILKDAREQGREPTELEILKSDWLDNGDGTYSKKSLKQKAIDAYYILQFNLITDRDEMRDMLINFTDGDMKNVGAEDPGPAPVLGPAPKKPEPPQYAIKLNDKEKGQWYVNLWHYMNGSESANKVQEKNVVYDNKEELIFTVEDLTTSEIAKNRGTYELFDDNLISDSSWLKNALEHGIVTLAQAEYFNPALDSNKVPAITSEGIVWNSIIHTSAPDIKAKDDEVAVSIAEVKYKKALKEIQSQDKKYDQDLKQLDTEHNALQSEYESLKSVIGKNVERSFKVFS